MKKRSQRIRRVEDLARAEEQTHCRAMGDAQRRLDEQQQRLDELKAYRREYAARRPGNGVATSVQYADYQQFLSRLDAAVDEQSRAVLNGRQQRDAQRARWAVKRRKVESLQRVADRYRDDERRDDERRAQKLQDDLPARPDPFRR